MDDSFFLSGHINAYNIIFLQKKRLNVCFLLRIEYFWL